MELKPPVKKGYKTPRYRPPLPILNESSPGLCVDEYDWPMFTGYYNGTSVIVDDARGIVILTNKGFFGKGSLSKGCPNLAKRKVPNNVVYESQWKRRKKWMESLNLLLKCKDFSNNTASSENKIDNPVNAEIINDITNKTDDDAVIQNSIKNSEENDFDGKDEELPMLIPLDDNEKQKFAICADDRSTDQSTIDCEKNQVESSNSDKKEQIIETFKFTQKEGPSKDEHNKNLETEDVTPNQLVNHHSKSDSNRDSSYHVEKGILKANEVLVISDIGNDLEQYFMNLNPHIEEEKIKTAVEVLYLSLEEAFFLCYACNCLQIVDLSTNILRIKDMWVLFQNSQADFIEKYIAYHYFRAKGWVVKSGTKFGGDFSIVKKTKMKSHVQGRCHCKPTILDVTLLYKKGPLYFHASYIVIVEVIKNDVCVKNKITWQKIIGMNRMAESATKELLICHVIWPSVEKEKFSDPSVLKEFSVSETLLRRWQATQEKNA